MQNIRRKRFKQILLIAFLLIFIMMLPTVLVQRLRSVFVTFFATAAKKKCDIESPTLAHHKLLMENHQLRSELAKFQAIFAQQSSKEEPIVLATVIYRDPISFSSSFWIDVGHKANADYDRVVVAKNSPIICGKSVVGAIDYVGENKSRVRLITDSGLNPSVRAVRGNLQNQFFLEHLETILRGINLRTDLTVSREERAFLLKRLEMIKERLHAREGDRFLAKGILQGRGAPLWRSANPTLHGIGFNYDFDDDAGLACDLVSGKPSDPKSPLAAVPLLKEGDLLVTTGMDGVFPAGLRVAEVTKVFPLKEGAYTYSLEAVPTTYGLNALHYVFVMPPVKMEGYESR